jgi:hypothetical protein
MRHLTCLLGSMALAGALTASADARSGAASPLDGRWTFTWTPAQMRPICASCAVGRFLVEFRDGHVIRLPPKPVLRTGRFSVRGNLASFVFPAPAPAGIIAGRMYAMRWSIYRDRLTWSKVPGRPLLEAFLITPWVRVR